MYTYTDVQLQAKTFGELKSIARELDIVPLGDRRCRQNWIDAIVGVELPLLALIENSLGVEVEEVQEPIALAAKTPPGVETDLVQDLIQVQPQKSKSSIAHQLLELFKSSAVTFQEPIAPAVKISPGVETDSVQEPIAPAAKIPPGVTFSDRFLARYSPPQPEIHYQADVDGQLTLLDFEVESQPEPPDPDDFESLDAFREAIARWDAQHPEPLEVSLDSFCEWAPCPDDWYEPDTLLEPSEVMEVSLPVESSSTCKFLIPVFGAQADRANRNFLDEPPDTGVGARLPKPKPPSFPPLGVVAGDRINCIKKFARSATLLSGRAPPGGDAVF